MPKPVRLSLDAMGVPAMLGRPVVIESSCSACGTAIRLAVRPGAVTAAEPVGTTVVAKRASDAPAVEACCDFTVFACGPAHATNLVARISDTAALDLETALGQGAALFANLLGETLPARRSRARSAPGGKAAAGDPSAAPRRP